MKKDYIIGSGNVFEDLGFKYPEEELAKARLASIINELIEERGLTQDQAGKILGVNQPKISALKNGRLKGFSLERLFSFLEKLDQHIEITVTDKSKVKAKHSIEVAHIH